RRDPGPGPPPGRARQGRRHRDVLHLRRPDRRPVVARAPAARPHRDRPRWTAAARGTRVAVVRSGLDGVRRRPPEWLPSDPASTAYAELAGKTTFSAREAVVGMLRGTGDLDGEPKP